MQSTPESVPGNRSRSSKRWLVALFVLVIGLMLGAAGGYQYARQSVMATPSVVITGEQMAARDSAVRQSQAESRFLRAQLDTADGEIAVERAARKELEAQLRATQDEVGLVRERLAFFEQLLPPGPEGVVDIRGAEVQRDGQGLKYRVLLMRSGRSDVPFTGALRFQASGILKGDFASVDLAPMHVRTDVADGASNTSENDKTPGDDKPAAPDAASSLLPLQFDQYQRTEGVLDLPAGFVPESVIVSVLEGTTVRASRTIKLAF